ncbi:MAG: hypothetical protein IK062_00060 [Selenomonadaceae bacterium]|nr:hypothetical protein [Selenomonadaceae bacterium]
MGITKSIYYYLKNSEIDKYRELRIKIREIFEENREVKIKRTRKYNSYKGEITPAVENLISRDFHADKSNENGSAISPNLRLLHEKFICRR